MKRADVVLATGTLATVLFAGMVLAATGALEEFLSWAWERPDRRTYILRTAIRYYREGSFNVVTASTFRAGGS